MPSKFFAEANLSLNGLLGQFQVEFPLPLISVWIVSDEYLPLLIVWIMNVAVVYSSLIVIWSWVFKIISKIGSLWLFNLFIKSVDCPKEKMEVKKMVIKISNFKTVRLLNINININIKTLILKYFNI